MNGTPKKLLAAYLDGAPLPEPEAHALWDRFSLWMEEHRGDLAGFAASEGYASVKPGVEGDRPVLRASRSATQTPYAPVRPAAEPPRNAQRVPRSPPGAGGSQARQRGAPSPGTNAPGAADPSRKPQN
ncbi:MAG: hypothetical protein JWP97_4414 [Labilithrix sp.]|nr:hypothetical protein [Labilithrix sp.]